MASGKGNFLSNALLNHIFDATAYSPPASLDVALYTVVPSGAGGGTEVTGGSYARQNIDIADWTTSTTQSTSNTSSIDFPTATANWGTVVAVAVFEVGTNDLMYWGNLTVNRVVNDGDSVRFAIGGLVIGES